jgi:hypothetical protein
MSDPTKLQTIREKFSETTFPQLYSKRGFEKSRIRFIIPPDKTQLSYITDKNGTRLVVEL